METWDEEFTRSQGNIENLACVAHGMKRAVERLEDTFCNMADFPEYLSGMMAKLSAAAKTVADETLEWAQDANVDFDPSRPEETGTKLGKPDELLEAAARLTLRLALRCDWVEGCEDKDDPDEPDSWNGIYERIGDLMEAYIHSREGQDGSGPDRLMTRFADIVADTLAKIPSLRTTVAAYVASRPDEDP